MKALEQGAKLHLMFQSLCGSEKGLRAFGVTLPMLREAWDMTKRLGQATGPNVMYFETGQGSALSADAHHGVDQQTCEARNYGIARELAAIYNLPLRPLPSYATRPRADPPVERAGRGLRRPGARARPVDHPAGPNDRAR